jgi:hypothetical protein
VLGIAYLVVSYTENHKILNLIIAVAFIFAGVYNFFNGFGFEKAWIRSGPDFIIIKWSEKLRPVKFLVSGITKVALSRNNIVFHQKTRNPVKFNILFLERDQKKEIYQYMIDFAEKHGLILERDF